MRRDPRPFVVEVRRGQKKSTSTPAPAPLVERSFEDDLMRRAEEALFGRPEEPRDTAPGPEAAGAAAAAPAARRILEAIVPEVEAPAPLPLVEPQPVRRGRKPGSKNRPKPEIEAESAGKRRRGRPRKHPDGAVRKVEITPELASAALDTMARAAPAPLPPGPMSLEGAGATPAEAPKRPRGRPRKLASTAGLVPLSDEDGILAPASAGMSPTRIISRYGDGPRLPAGRLWTRRLRGYANPGQASRRAPRA